MDQLGINLPSLIFQIINFLVLAAVLSKFLYKPVIKMLDERQTKINEGLELTVTLKEAAAELAVEKQKIVKQANVEAAKIIAAAKKAAADTHTATVTAAVADIDQLKTKLAQDAASQLTTDRQKLKTEALTLAGELAKKVLTDSLDSASQSKLISKSLTQLKHLHVSN